MTNNNISKEYWNLAKKHLIHNLKRNLNPFDLRNLNPFHFTEEEIKEQEIFIKELIEINTRHNTQKAQILYQELNSLIGLEEVKKQVSNLIDFANISQKRKQVGLPISSLNLHLVFSGSPGTGKTTVARIIGKLYKHLNILKKGHCIEIDRSKIVSGYIGHTAKNMDKLIESALDGVLVGQLINDRLLRYDFR